MQQTISTLPSRSQQNMSFKVINRRNVLILSLLAVVFGGYFAWQPIKGFWLPAVPDNIAERYVCIPTGASFE